MTIIADCTQTAEALLAVVAEEMARLGAGEPAADLGELVKAKVRLTDQLVAGLAALRRVDPAAVKAVAPEERERLKALLKQLDEAAVANDKLIARKKALSEELLDAVLSEARRQSGATLTGYGRHGAATASNRPAAIAVDTRL